MPDNQPATLGSVERAFGIIDHLSRHPNSRLADLTDALDIPKSTIFTHLQTLKACGFVIKEADRYRLSLRFLHHGGLLRHQLPIYRHARDPAKELANNTGELVNIGVEENGLGVVIEMFKGGTTAVDLDPIGKYSYLHQAAYGKAMLANFSKTKVKSVIDRHGLPELTEETITDRDGLFEELDDIQKQGYAMERDEGDIGIGCIGTAILGPEGHTIGGISVTLPSSKFEHNSFIDQTIQYTLDCANIIELQLQHGQEPAHSAFLQVETRGG